MSSQSAQSGKLAENIKQSTPIIVTDSNLNQDGSHSVQFELQFEVVCFDDAPAVPQRAQTKKRPHSTNILENFLADTSSIQGKKNLRQSTSPKSKQAKKKILKKTENYKFQISYSFVNGQEARTEPFNHQYPFWNSTHDVNVNTDLLLDLYERPIEFTIWRARKVIDTDANENTEKHVTTTAEGNLLKPVDLARRVSKMNLQKRSILLEDYHRRMTQISAVMDGQKTPPQPHHYDLPEKMIHSNQLEEELMQQFREETVSNALFDMSQLRDGQNQVESSAERPNSSSSARSKTPPHPHHYDNPDKHIDSVQEDAESEQGYISSSQEYITPPKVQPSPHHSESADKTIYPPGSRPLSSRSRPSSSRPRSGDVKVEIDRPKTPVAPHHFDSPERTQKPFQDPRLPRLARTGRIPEEFVAVGKLYADARCLFFGDLEIEAELSEKISGLSSAKVKISLDKPLLSDTQLENLNPMCVQIIGAENMPEKPDSKTLINEYQETYVKFNFVDSSEHRTKGVAHAKNVFWNSRHLILTGTHDPNELKQQLLRKLILFEVHDRDKKGYFISVDGKEELSEDDDRTFGVSSASLADIVLDSHMTTLKFSVPVLPGPIGKIPGSQWLQCKTMLKVKIEVAYPILLDSFDLEKVLQKNSKGANNPINAKDPLYEYLQRYGEKGPYTRIVMVFSAKQSNLVGDILEIIRSINMASLGFKEDNPLRHPDFFDQYKLSPNERHDIIDILTGCHVYDNDYHFIFLEGPSKNSMKGFLSSATILDNIGKIRLFAPHINGIDTTAKHFSRLWLKLKPHPTHVSLKIPLAKLIQTCAIYTRKHNSALAFEGIRILNELLSSETTYNYVNRHHLFLTLPMIEALSEKYAAVLDQYPCSSVSTVHQSIKISSVLNSVCDKNASQCLLPITRNNSQKMNPDFEKYLAEAKLREPNFVRLNALKFVSSAAPLDRGDINAGNIYIYSQQALNTSEIKKRELYKKLLSRYPKKIFHIGNLTTCLIDTDDKRKV